MNKRSLNFLSKPPSNARERVLELQRNLAFVLLAGLAVAYTGAGLEVGVVAFGAGERTWNVVRARRSGEGRVVA